MANASTKRKTTSTKNPNTKVKVEVEDENTQEDTREDRDNRYKQKTSVQKKYDYTIVNVPNDARATKTISELKANGADGWRLVSIEVTSTGKNLLLEKEIHV